MQAHTDTDVVVIGAGLGGLVAGSLLARYGRRVVICESHTVPGGAAHAYVHRHEGKRFLFDAGPSFFCGLGDASSANPLTQVLSVLSESVEAVPYEPFGYYHFPEGTLPVYGDSEKYRKAIAQFSPTGAQEFEQLERKLLKIYAPLKTIPTLALRGDWRLIPRLLGRYPGAIAQLLPVLRDLNRSLGQVMAPYVRDPWLKRLLDLECFLLSGLPCEHTVAPEMAFMFGERASSVIDYPVGGSGAIVDALVRGLKKYGGELRLKTPVEKIQMQDGKVQGVQLKNGDRIAASTVISNASVWDTYQTLLTPEDLPESYRQRWIDTPAVDSFMHLHTAFRSDGLESLPIHHVVVHDSEVDISEPGNTCMVSIPTALDSTQAPDGYHTLHAYTLEPYEPWSKLERRSDAYQQRKQSRVKALERAVEKLVPDWRDRTLFSLIGTPLTHQRYLRRYRGTYGPALKAPQQKFPSGRTPIKGLFRVGDSTLPGIGVPAVAASGILCANSLVPAADSAELTDQLGQYSRQ